MKVIGRTLFIFFLGLLFLNVYGINNRPLNEDPRIQLGRSILEATLDTLVLSSTIPETNDLYLSVNPSSNKLPHNVRLEEGYNLSVKNGKIEITGYDAAGVLYGCLALQEEINLVGTLPAEYQVCDAPVMKLRGTCIFLKKQGSYNQAVTPERFPFFYDEDLWRSYLDFLLENRFNYVVLGNSHAIDYFIEIEKYPEVQRGISRQLLKKNRDMLRWLCAEGEKRNIHFLFQLDNIETSNYIQRTGFLSAEKVTPAPLLNEYIAYSINEFLREFPQVGIYLTSGTELNLIRTDQWIKDVLIPAKRQRGKFPPVVFRSLGIDLEHARKISNDYPYLYWEREFNAGMIADTRIDPEVKEWKGRNKNPNENRLKQQGINHMPLLLLNFQPF